MSKRFRMKITRVKPNRFIPNGNKANIRARRYMANVRGPVVCLIVLSVFKQEHR